MPLVPMPLPDIDYQTMNLTDHDFWETLWTLPKEVQYYVINTTNRLAEATWITETAEEQAKRNTPPVVQEGLLSLQLYLLLTCADTLGHVYSNKKKIPVGERFRLFFKNLPTEAKHDLAKNILAWRTNFADYPSLEQVIRSLQPWTPEERLNVIIDFLYFRRNYYTHQSDYPQLGYHLNLSVMQNQRLNVPNTATIGKYDRLQPMVDIDKKIYYFTYYETDDLIATIRWSIIRGLGKIIGSVQ